MNGGLTERWLPYRDDFVALDGWQARKALVDVWLNLRHDPESNYGLRLEEIDAYEAR